MLPIARILLEICDSSLSLKVAVPFTFVDLNESVITKYEVQHGYGSSNVWLAVLYCWPG